MGKKLIKDKTGRPLEKIEFDLNFNPEYNGLSVDEAVEALVENFSNGHNSTNRLLEENEIDLDSELLTVTPASKNGLI